MDVLMYVRNTCILQSGLMLNDILSAKLASNIQKPQLFPYLVFHDGKHASHQAPGNIPRSSRLSPRNCAPPPPPLVCPPNLGP